MRSLLLGLILFISFVSFQTRAAHIVGGEVFVDSLGNDMYKVTFEIYRDCQGAGAAFDNPLNYTVFNADGTIYSTYPVLLFSSDVLPITYDDPCVTPPNDICIQLGVYIDTITLPATPGGYTITYQRCCWANNFVNIVNPADNGITITTGVPGTDLVGNFDNQTARFDDYPPMVLCAGITLDFDHVAIDPDGDSLVYSICDPLTVSNLTGPVYDPEFAPPYSPVAWEVGFSSAQPFGPGSSISIDPVTGLLTVTPGMIGNYVAAVCVEEWRDGVLINSKNRTFGYRVVECDVIEPMQVAAISQGELIEGCNSAAFIVSRDDSTDAVSFQVQLSGTATNGIDYNFIEDTLFLAANQGSDTVFITPEFDGLTEGNETIYLNVIIYDFCNDTYDTTSASLTIVDYIPMIVFAGDSLNLCDEFGETGSVWCEVLNGVPPYDFVWSPLPYGNNDTIQFPAADLEPNLNNFTVTVYDACGYEITSDIVPIYNQCPVVAPNVITADGDNINDLFVLKNLEDYDRVEIEILNRWGNLIYSNQDYQNDWDGKTQNGKELDEGVYFYIVRPISEKFEYDDQQSTIFVLHGFFHIIK